MATNNRENKLENKTREYRQIIEQFIRVKNELRHNLQSLRTLLEESERFENIDNAYRTIQGNINTITNSTDNTISSIKDALQSIKLQNENTLSRALDNYSTAHPNTALAKQYKICKEYIKNLEIPTATIVKEEM